VWILTRQVKYDHTFCTHQILQKKCDYNKAVHQLFIDFKKSYDSVRREVLYNIIIIIYLVFQRSAKVNIELVIR